MFTGTLFESQKEGAQFICAKKTGILAWEQGTGKTVISIASSERLLDLGLLRPSVLVLAPSAITWQWEEKIKEFTTNEATLIHAKSEYRGTYETPTPYTITSYNLFRRDFEVLSRVNWDLVVCDEAQEFKNNKSKTAKLLKELNTLQQPQYRWALTGTVISNKLEELYSIMYWVDKYFLPDWYEFEKRHIVRNSNTNQILRYKELQSLSAYLPRRLNRRTQKDLGDQMPKLVEKTHYIEKELELKNAELNLLGELDELAASFDIRGGQIRCPAAAKAFHEVLQLLASPKKIQYAVHLAESLLEENPENRVVIFSHLKDPLHFIKDKLYYPGYLFTGDVKTESKREAITQFQKVPSVLLSSNAGKAGLDLPFANYIIHLDVPFSYEVLDQRNKRITRASSKFKTAKVNYLVVKNSIEEYYLKIVKSKEQLSDAIYYGKVDRLKMKTQTLRNFLEDRVKDKRVCETKGSS